MMEVHEDPIASIPAKGVRLIVCLGNPGRKYEGTRHNAGWQVADKLLKERSWQSSPWQPDNGMLYEWQRESDKVYLLKPLTYMNDSGLAVNDVAEYLGLSPQEILVLCDCLDLPAGALRLRKHGSSGGQRGVQSIIQTLGTADFPRLRVGIGRPEPGGEEIIDYVLSPWASAENAIMQDAFQAAANLTLTLLEKDWDSALNFTAKRTADNINARKQGEPEIGKV